ncbi:hypothetical protein N9L19_01075, partial [bacterium]|nr:hypothetical protein [bacterium]
MEQDMDVPPLMQALFSEEWDKAMSLIEEGAKVNHKDWIGITPLHLAARCSKPDVVRLLLEKKADANAITYKMRAPGGYCPLTCLADANHRQLSQGDIVGTASLLFEGMNAETFARQTGTERTLWHLLCCRGKYELVDWLLRKFDQRHGRLALADQFNIIKDMGVWGKGKRALDDA